MRSTRAVPLLGMLMAVSVCAAQNVVNDSTAAVIAYWKPGDRRVYAVERVVTGPKPARSSYDMNLLVVDETDSTYVLECLFSGLKVDATLPEDPREKAVFNKLMMAADGLRITVSTDETGIPLALVRPQDVEEHARQVMLGILDMAMSHNERLRMETTLGPVVDADVLAQDALEDLGNLLFPFGVAYITGRVEEVEAEVPNPLGGIPFRTQQTFVLERLDSLSATAHMRMAQHIDPKAVDDDIEDLLASCGGADLQGDAREKLRRTIEGVKVNETMELEVDLHGAWTKRLVFTRENVVRGVTRTDTRTYTLR